MNKGLGATTGAAVILAAGALLRPAVVQPTVTSAAETSAASAAVSPAKGEGPWKASSQYWAPVREVPVREIPDREIQESSGAKSADFTVSVTGTGAAVDAHMRISTEKSNLPCKDRLQGAWGIPRQLPGGATPEITAIIAAVPDPERGHLQLDFDRTLDALMQAASDNGYLGSYFWLPWKATQTHDEKGTAVSGTKAEDAGGRRKQPGLVVLTSGQTEANSYGRVIYLFLVAATPTQGIDGEELSNAFEDEACLLSLPGTTLSLRPRSDQGRFAEMDLLLFNYSGAAASLREGLYTVLADSQNHHPQLSKQTIDLVSIAGATSTKLVGDLFNKPFGRTRIQFHSFQEDTGAEESESTNLFRDEEDGCAGIALLAEGGTAFGSLSSNTSTENYRPAGRHEVNPILMPCGGKPPLGVIYPREISLLRNATAKEGDKGTPATDATISPYLHFSLQDSKTEDSIPHFSGDDTPLSQEAQLMAIGRQLARSHVHTIAISATNILDEIFLAQFFHRACPDARLVFLGGGDLLLERGVESAPYVGALTISPYNLVNMDHESEAHPSRTFASSTSEAYYNAASFIFRDQKAPALAGYPKRPDSEVLRPLLWATTVGRDGYYPLGILDPCASYREDTLPDIQPDGETRPCTATKDAPPTQLFKPGEQIYPSMAWYALCITILLLSLAHGAVLLTASYWSPFTRDLAIHSSDRPRRRAVYVNIATVMLFSMAFVVTYPLFSVLHHSEWLSNGISWHSDALLCALLTLVAALVSLMITASKTWPYTYFFRRTELYATLHSIAALTFFVVPIVWAVICGSNQTIGVTTYAGLFFSYRCLHPESGVSPLLPLLLLLLAWYLWGVCQTLRLRFSINSRPQLPRDVHATTAYPLYVSEKRLSDRDPAQSSCLYCNITCLLITREIVRRFFRLKSRVLDIVLLAVYFGLFSFVLLRAHVQSLDHFLWNARSFPTFYEFLVRALLFPLMMIALTGWVRVIFIWTSFRRGLLEPLEQLPLRFAFTRLKGVGWMTMLRQGGLQEYWRDMARSTESMRQMIHNPGLERAIWSTNPARWIALKACYAELEDSIRDLLQLIADSTPQRRKGDSKLRRHSRDYLVGNDIPGPHYRDELNLMAAIERSYARCCELLLEALLIPYWNQQRTGLVEGEPATLTGKGELGSAAAADPGPYRQDQESILVAEEFLALRYVSVIRAVLVNLRYTMIFVSTAFALAILAWNSYPFRPRYWVDCMFTVILVTLGAGIVWVFAQMYRNPILSRITDTSANELGIEFYLRLATFGAVPLLTWLASEFPAIGNSLYHFLKPGLEVVK